MQYKLIFQGFRGQAGSQAASGITEYFTAYDSVIMLTVILCSALQAEVLFQTIKKTVACIKEFWFCFWYPCVCGICMCVSQCNATCGRGVRQRQVVCAGLDGGVFKEFPDSSCDQTNKPETSSSCFQRPCSKWFTTSWSQVAVCFRKGQNIRLFTGIHSEKLRSDNGYDMGLLNQEC